jgi:hypothetical protein
MKAVLKLEQEFDIKTLVVNAQVRYWEDTEVDGVKDSESGDLIPCRDGETWKLEIDIGTGKINNWKQGVTADVHYKVCDAGIYSLLDQDGKVFFKYDGYVPHCLCPKSPGYGDYIIMDIDANGIIKNWKIDEDDIQEMVEDRENLA